MDFIVKLLAKIVLNGVALFIAKTYLIGFVLTGSLETLGIAALVLALLNLFLRPVLRLLSAPLVWITFGLFNIAIYGFILWLADFFLAQITIVDYTTLFWVSIIIAIANAFF